MSVDDLFLLIVEKVLTFISGGLDVFRMLSRYDNRISCIAPCKSKIQFAHIMSTEIQEVLGTGEERGYTERCNGWDMGERTPACSGGTACTFEPSGSPPASLPRVSFHPDFLMC